MSITVQNGVILSERVVYEQEKDRITIDGTRHSGAKLLLAELEAIGRAAMYARVKARMVD